MYKVFETMIIVTLVWRSIVTGVTKGLENIEAEAITEDQERARFFYSLQGCRLSMWFFLMYPDCLLPKHQFPEHLFS